jgi:hypothetical protein
MRFMIMVKATKESESGATPSAEMIAKMGNFNDELVKAGVMLDAAGLTASSKGARVRFTRGKATTVIDGPFTETKELVAGYWIWQCKSLAEAVEWVKRCPDPHPDAPDSEIEIRPILDLAEVPGLLEEARAIQDRRAASKK